MRNILTLALLIACAPDLGAQASTVILVRHAEKAAPTGDVDLSAIGQTRAADLATALAAFPLQGIFVTPTKRTLQTATPTATRAGLTPVAVPVAGGNIPAHAAATAAAIRALPAGSAALVVGHSNTLAKIIAALGGPQGDDLCDPEYATMFILELPASGTPRLIRAHYGAPDAQGADACRNPVPALEGRQP